MAKIKFTVNGGSAKIEQNFVEAFNNALTPRRYVELFMTPLNNSLNPILKAFVNVFMGSCVGIWTDELEEVSKLNYILMDGEIHRCIIFMDRNKQLVFLIRRDYGSNLALAEKVQLEDGDILYTTYTEVLDDFEAMKKAKMEKVAEINRKRDEQEKEEVLDDEGEDEDAGPQPVTIDVQIKKLMSEKMSMLARIRKINKQITELEAQRANA